MIKVENLNFSYGKRQVLKGLSFGIEKGSSVSILGANGSGKSTLLRVMLGFLKFNGLILINGKNLREYSPKQLASIIAYVPQNNFPNYDYTVLDVALMGALNRTSLLSNFSRYDKAFAQECLQKMGIAHLKNEPYTRISGGERQLTYIARALVQRCKVVFMDEPTNGLDFGNQIKILNMIKSLANDGYTMVQTTHHPRHAQFASNLAMLLKNGKILDYASSDKLINAKNMAKIYGLKTNEFDSFL